MDDAKELARTLAKKAPLTIQAILDTVARGLETTIDQGLQIELESAKRVQKTVRNAEMMQGVENNARRGKRCKARKTVHGEVQSQNRD